MHKYRTLLVLLVAVCLLAPAGAQQFRQPPPYRILVTNDDGVRAPGVAAVAQALQAIGTPIIVAPAENQSGKGHSIVTTEPVFRQDLSLPNGLPAIGLTATPASTVNIAIRNIVMPLPDLVVSGVNTEYNLGLSTYVSGTVGAARTGAESFVEMKHPSGRTIYWNVYSERKSPPQPEGTDFWAVENGWVSVTPMSVDETDPAQFDALRAIFK
jgi:broad specificity polyphosphatase/5'/3'-nucleotidase SurE